MKLTTRAVPIRLAPFVECLWHFAGELPHARERILPTGTMQLLVNLDADELRTYHGDGLATMHRLRGTAISGAHARPFAVDTAEQRAVVGAAFTPGGASAFFAAPATELRDLHVELAELWRDGADLRDRLLEARHPAAMLEVLEAMLVAHLIKPADPMIDAACRALDRGIAVATIVDRAGMPRARFARRFAAGVGLSPKRFMRVRRLGHVLACAERSESWAEIAAGCGYADQAHLIHEFRELTGLVPTAYAPRAAGDRNHVAM
jgi:AraC-like DNA-binding protein